MSGPVRLVRPASGPKRDRAGDTPAALRRRDGGLGLARSREEELAALRRRVVEPLAPQLGLAAREVLLAGGEAGRRARSFGARGLVEGRTVFLAPGLGEAEAAAVLVHELAHVAQQRPATAQPPAVRPAAADPEREARALVEAWRAGLPLWRPIALLPAGAIAADVGGVGTLPRPPAARTAPATTPPGLAADRQEELEVGQREAELGRIVNRRWRAERDRLIDLLDGLWVSAGDVRDCLSILDTFPFLVARAMARSLPDRRRTDLAAGLEDAHHRGYPAAALATLAALAPIQLRRIEATSVNGLDLRSADTVQERAALGVLQALRQDVLLAVLRGDRGSYFRGLLTGPRPSGTDVAALDEVLRILRADEADAATLGQDAELRRVIAELGTTLRSPNEAQALRAIERLTALAPAPPALAASGPASATATGGGTSGDTTLATPDPGPRLRHGVGRLDVEGAIGRLLGALSERERSSAGSHATQLLLVLAAREPSLNLALIESLLSYGIFDWAIRDHEARFAYLLVRSLPIDAQERWKRLDEGKWFQRLEDNIPAEDILEGRYRGVGRDASAFDPATRDRLTSDAMATVRDIDRAMQGDLNGPKAVELLRRLLQLGRTGTAGARGGAERQRLLRIAVQRLDSLGHMDRILDALPDAYLLNEMWRAELLEVLVARDPRHIERQVRSLLSYGILDWAVTAREAWLAYQVVRSLPAGDQARLQAEDPDRWDRIQAEMTAEMRASSGITAIGAVAGLAARDRLRERLRDLRLWTPRRAVELRSLIIQLYALDDRRWVFLQSRDVRVDQISGMERLGADMRLYHERDRPHFEPEALRAPTALQESLGALGRYIVATPQLLGLLHDVISALLSPEMQLEGLDIELLQRLNGGDVAGARLQPREVAREEDRRDGRDARRPEPNRLSIWLRPAEGRLRIELPRLELVSLMHTGPGMSVRTGRASLIGLTIVADFSDRGYNRPVGATLDAEEIDVTDIVVASAEALIAATHLGLRPLHLRAGQRGSEDLTAPAPPRTIPIPVIGPLLNAMSHILALTGTLPGLGSLGGTLTAPATAGSGFLIERYSSFVANQTVTPLAEGLLGLITDGTFRKPRTVEERARDAAAMMRSFAVSFGELTLDGLSFGGQQQVASLTVRDVFLGIGFSRTTYLRHQIASLERRKGSVTGEARTTLEAEQTRLRQQLTSLEGWEAELDRLESRYRWDNAGLNDAERARLVELSDLLRQTAGATVDIGGISARGLGGMVEAAGIDVGAIHAEAATPARAGEYLPDEQLIARFRRGGGGPTMEERTRQSEVSASVGPVRVLPGEAGEPVLRLRTGAPLPTPEELQRRIDALPEGSRHREELTPWVSRLRELARLEAIPAAPEFSIPAAEMQVELLPPGDPRRAELESWLAWLREVAAGRAGVAEAPRREDGSLVGQARSPAEEANRQRLREEAERFFGIEIGGLTLGGITLRRDSGSTAEQRRQGQADSLGLDIVVSDLEATDIRTGTTRVARISGAGVSAGVGLHTGTEGRPSADLQTGLDRLGIPGARPAGRFGADRFGVQGVDAPGTTLRDLTVIGLAGSVVPAGEDLRIPDLRASAASITGLDYTSSGRSIFAAGTTTLTDITADISLQTAPVAAGPGAGAAPARPRLVRSAAAPSQAEPAALPRRVSAITVNTLRIGRIEAGAVGMDVSEPAPGFRVEATGGALVGFFLHNLRLDLPAEGTAPELPAPEGTRPNARLGVERFEGLRFSVLSRALQGGPTTVAGRLDSPALPGARPEEREAAAALGVELLESGERRIDLRGATLSEGLVTTPDGRIRIRHASLAGRIVQEAGGRLRFDRLGPLRVEVSELDWRTAAGARITARGSTVLDGIEAQGWWESTPAESLSDGTTRPARSALHLDTARIASITSDNLRYQDGTVNLRLGRFDRPNLPGMPPLEVRDIQVAGLSWDNLEGVTEGRVDVGRTALDIAGRVDAAMHLRGSVAAQSIMLEFHRGGQLFARVRGGEGDIGLGATAAADGHHLSFAGLDTGIIDIRPDSIEIGPEGREGLHLPVLTLDALNWLGSGIGITIAPGDGAVTLLGTRARVRIELNPPGHPRGRFKRMILRQLSVPQIRASGIRVKLSSTATIKLDADQEAVIAGLELVAPEGEEGFVVEPSRTAPGLVQRGSIELAAFRLPRVAADVTDLLTGTADFAAAGMTVEFLGIPGEALGMNVLLREPSLTAIQANLGPRFGEVFALRSESGPGGLPEYGLRARAVSYQRREPGAPGGERDDVAVEGLNLSGFRYVNPALGIRVFLRSGHVEGDVTHDILTGSGAIPRLVVEDASFAVDLATLLGSAPASAGGGAVTAASVERAWDNLITALRPFRGVIDHLDGHLDFNVQAGETRLPVRLTFVDGALQYDRLAAGVRSGDLPYNAEYLTHIHFQVSGDSLELWVRNPLWDVRVMSWQLATGEVSSARDDRLIGLWRALHPDSRDRTWVAEQLSSALSGPSGSLSINGIDADLSLVNRNEIVLPLGGPNELVLAPNAVAHLRASGGLGGRSARGRALRGAIEPISLDRATVARLHLVFGGTTVDTGRIEITDLTDTLLTFSGLAPQLLTGTIRRATADNIRWQVPRPVRPAPGGAGSRPGATPPGAPRRRRQGGTSQ